MQNQHNIMQNIQKMKYDGKQGGKQMPNIVGG